MSRLDKSQLRRLALDFADGDVAGGEYRARRRALVDGIVDGSVSIEREPPPDTTRSDPFSSAPATSTAAKPAHLWPFSRPVTLAMATAACVAIVTALALWPGGDPPPPAPSAPRPASTPAVGLSPARALVESFVARRNFTGDAVAEFEKQWARLSPADRDEALGALWFASLVRALRDEIKTQQALAGLAGGEVARARAERIALLGRTLGISAQLPDIGEAKPGTPDGLAPAAAGEDPATVASAPTLPAATPRAVAPEPAPAPGTLTGREWLERQADSQLTLQLFAVNGLDRVEQLIAAHPELSVRILATDGTAPRFRVFHGVFTDEAAARSAFDALPADITSASQGAIVKSFAAVRDDLAGRTPSVAPAANLSPDTDAAGYTLQLFATGTRANAESLVQAFPDLALQLREVGGDAAPFRVVYGRFESMDSARAAQSALPATLLSRIGTPLAKPLADTGSRLRP